MIHKPYVLACDPGLLSGLCLLRRDPFGLEWSDELEWVENARKVDETLRTLGGENVDVVAERFTITVQTAKNSQQGISLEVIGQLRLLSLAHGAAPNGEISLQSPNDAKNFVTNPRIRALGVWHKGGHGHALDAIRHGVLRLTRTGWQDSRLLLKN